MSHVLRLFHGLLTIIGQRMAVAFIWWTRECVMQCIRVHLYFQKFQMFFCCSDGNDWSLAVFSFELNLVGSRLGNKKNHCHLDNFKYPLGCPSWCWWSHGSLHHHKQLHSSFCWAGCWLPTQHSLPMKIARSWILLIFQGFKINLHLCFKSSFKTPKFNF